MSPSMPTLTAMTGEPPTASTRSEHPMLRRAWRSALAVGVVAVLVGLPVTVGGGYLNPNPQFSRIFLTVGLVGFFVPGVLVIAGAMLLRAGRSAGVWVSVGPLVWGALLGAALTGVQFTVEPVTPVPVLLTGLGALASLVAAWQVWSARHALRSAAGGFEVG